MTHRAALGGAALVLLAGLAAARAGGAGAHAPAQAMAQAQARVPSRAPAAPPAPPALPLSVAADRMDAVFAESLTFALDAEAGAPGGQIEAIVLRYTVGDDPVRNRRVPDFRPGRRVEATFVEDLVRGQIPPTAEITWWWELRDRSGRSATTPPRTARYLDERFDWRTLEGEDVRVWYYGGRGGASGADARRAAEVAGATREALGALAELVGAVPAERLEIVLYREQDDLRRAMLARGDVYASRLATLGARVSRHVVLLDGGSIERGMGRDALAQVLRHELSHVVLHLRLRHEWLDVPTWLDEGLAMYAEGPLGGNEKAALEAALAGDDLMSVRSLTSFPGDARRVTQAYGQSRDFVAFLMDDGGPTRFRALIDAYARADRPFEEVLRAVYGYDQLAMYVAYRAARGLPALAPPAAQEPRR